MNGFSYDKQEKKITIKDGTFIVIWENVEENIAVEAGEKFGRGEKIDDFLTQKSCKRYWGNNQDTR